MANQSRSRSRPHRPTGQTAAANGDPTAAGAKPQSSPLGAKASDEVKRPAAGTGHVQPRRAERRPDMIKRRREERFKAYERQRRTWLLTRIGLIGFGVLAVALIGSAIFNVVQDRVDNPIPEGTLNFDYSGGSHLPTIGEEYAYPNEIPPAGGTHDQQWQTCGFYSTPIRDENAVHSLEHGAVWITYQPTLPQEQVEELRDLANDQEYILVSPFADNPTPIVATSWNHQIQLETATDERLDQFIRRFKEGPDTPERGASCFGIGTPE